MASILACTFVFFSGGESCLAQARRLTQFHFQTTDLFTVPDITVYFVEGFDCM